MRRRAGALALLILLTLSLVPRAAFAEVYWNDTGDRKSAIVAGYPYGDWGRCSALMEFLGFDWSTIGNDARNKLLTNSNGDNRFTLALQQTKNLQYDAQTVGNIDLSMFNIWGYIFGYSEMWGVSLPYQTYYDTVAYVRGVITGGDDGTGGTDAPELNDAYEYFPVGGTVSGNLYTLNGFGSARYPHVVIDMTKSSTWFNGKSNVVILSADNNSAENKLRGYVALSLPDGAYAVRHKSDGYIYIYNSTDATVYYDYKYYDYNMTLESSGTYIPNASGNTNSHISVSAHRYEYVNISYVPTYAYNQLGAAPTPTPPQPDPPVTPPVTPTPPVYVPTPIGDVTVTQPDYSELTDWLKLIHRDLLAIEQQIVDTFNALDSDLAGWFQSLSDYIGDAAEWMADELEQYWDGLETNIVMWLKRIYSRMGGNGATKPDPTTDPKGFWEWLLEQFASFFAGNVDNAVDTLGDKLQELIEFFPFSIPWDVMGILALFSASPLTPQFDMYLPVPEVVDATGHIAMHIDLTPYDGLAHTIRSIELIIFAAWLATMVPTWLNQIKVSDKL